MTNIQGISAMVLCGISFVLAVVGMAIPFWIYASVGDKWASEGLWQRCNNVLGSTKCVGVADTASGIELEVADWLKAVRALEILGVLFIGGAGLCGFLKLFVSKNQDSLPKIAAATGIAAGVFMLIGAIVYGAKFAEIVPASAPNHLFVGFGLVIVAGIFAIVSGIMFVLAGNRGQI